MLLWRLTNRRIDFEHKHFPLFKNVDYSLRTNWSAVSSDLARAEISQSDVAPIMSVTIFEPGLIWNWIKWNFLRVRLSRLVHGRQTWIIANSLAIEIDEILSWEKISEIIEHGRRDARIFRCLRVMYLWDKSCQMSITCCVNLALARRILHHESYYDSFPDLGRNMTHLWMCTKFLEKSAKKRKMSLNAGISIKPEPNDLADEPPPLESKRLSSGENFETRSRGTNFYGSMRELNFDGMLQTMGGLMNDMKTMKTKLGIVLRRLRKLFSFMPTLYLRMSANKALWTLPSPRFQFESSRSNASRKENWTAWDGSQTCRRFTRKFSKRNSKNARGYFDGRGRKE